MFPCILILGWKVPDILVPSWSLNLFYLHINISPSYYVIMATCSSQKPLWINPLTQLSWLSVSYSYPCFKLNLSVWFCMKVLNNNFDLALSPFKIFSHMQFIYSSLFCLGGKTKFYYLMCQINIDPVRLNSPLKLTWLHKNRIQIRTLCGLGVFPLDLWEG